MLSPACTVDLYALAQIYVERELFFQMENKIKDILSGFLTQPLSRSYSSGKTFPGFLPWIMPAQESDLHADLRIGTPVVRPSVFTILRH